MCDGGVRATLEVISIFNLSSLIVSSLNVDSDDEEPWTPRSHWLTDFTVLLF